MESASLRPDTYMDVSTCSCPVYIPAQLLNVSGTVTDPAGEALVGVSVSVKAIKSTASPPALTATIR